MDSLQKEKMGALERSARILNWILAVVLNCLHLVVLLCTAYAPLTSKKELPPLENDLLLLSATQIAERIRNRTLKCKDIVNAYIERIKTVNPILNCVVQNRFEQALSEAQEVDIAIASTVDIDKLKKDRPLLGVPITVKETIAVQGLSNNSARSRVAGNIAERDAECVQLLRLSGAIPLVVTNTPELCLNWETFNPRFGTTKNPYDTRRTPGGSSGGEAALLGSGASVVGLGSDMAGSIRIPAMFCGVFGHKPTPGFIPVDGHLPNATEVEWDHYFVLGPLTRYAEDLPLITRRMVPEKNRPDLLKLEEPVDVSKLKIYYMFGEGPNAILQGEISNEVKDLLTSAANYMQMEYGCRISRIQVPGIEDCIDIGILPLRMTVENVYQPNDKDTLAWNFMTVIKGYLKRILGQTTASFNGLIYGPVKIFVDSLPDSVVKMMGQKRLRLQNKFNELLDENAVLLYPTYPTCAPYHNRTMFKMFNSTYNTIFTLLGLPSTQCPMGIDQNGMPIGIQVVGAVQQDRLCMAVAKALEKGFGGWRPPRS